MKWLKRKEILCLCFSIFFQFILFSTIFAQGKISGQVFGDFYYNLTNNKSELKDQDGFWFRRVYFTYDYKFSDTWSTRFRIEAMSPGDFKTSETLKISLKDAYISYNKRGNTFIIGLSPTPTVEYLESFWGYRAVEKTPLDLYKMGDTREFGIAFKGSIGKKGFLGYHLQIGNGEGVKSEFNKGKKFMGAFQLKFTENLSFELYGDYAENGDHRDYHTYQGFLGWKKEKHRLGILLAHQRKEQGLGNMDLKINVYSLFGIINLSEKVTALTRFDRMDNSLPWGPSISYVPMNGSAPFSLFIAGLDFHPIKNISFIPNIMFVFYDKVNGEKIGKDIQLKFTFFYVF